MANIPDIIVPVALELDWPTADSIIADIREQHTRFGIRRFALAGPCGGWRSVGYPPREVFSSLAGLFVQIRDTLAPEGLEFGWWVTATLKSGHSKAFSPIVKADGSDHPFSNCPLDPEFRRIFASDVAFFAAKAHPAFILTEDDYSIAAASGCFCDRHVAEFSRRMGRQYTRSEIAGRLSRYTPDDPSFELEWRKLKRDSIVGLSEAVRRELDILTPEIPMGYAQAGGSDTDGDCTEAICRALAGPRHTPFCRFYGASYGGIDTKTIPEFLYHPVYDRQHIPEPFTYIHETDTFPQNRYFMAGAEIGAVLAAVCSQGFASSVMQTQQLIDDPNEEKTYGDAFAAEHARLATVCGIVSQCERAGVCIPYDPFWNTYDRTQSTWNPQWTPTVSRFGIPYVTTDAPIAFWDERQAAHASDAEVKDRLSRAVFLDGDAALALCRRGYGPYLGVEVTEADASAGGVQWDLGAREVIREGFGGKGRNMPSAHMYSPPGNGILRVMRVTGEKTEVVTDAYTFRHEHVCPAMTRFENSLGGRVAVMGMTLDRNRSQALFNYRRRRLIHELMLWMGGAPCFARDADLVYVIENRAKDPMPGTLLGMLTLTNLCADPRGEVRLYLEEGLRSREYLTVAPDGSLQPAETRAEADGIVLKAPLPYLAPLYLVVR